MRKYLIFSVLLAAAAVYLSGCNQAQGTQAAPAATVPARPSDQFRCRNDFPGVLRFNRRENEC